MVSPAVVIITLMVKLIAGRVPLRRLVYRVQPLPQSLLPLVWDFGQLNTQVEDLYIRQMVRRYVSIAGFYGCHSSK